MSKEALAQLKIYPEVEYIEPNSSLTLGAFQTPAPSWALDRIDQRDLPLDDVFQYSRTGLGVHVYILDTGILATHVEFRDRVGVGYDFIDNDSIPNDCNGHGTQVAGLLGGETTGVAKDATIHPIRSFHCNGKSTVGLAIKGIEWIITNHEKPAVVNMSFIKTSGTSSVLDSAIENLWNNGISPIVIAGNNAVDACSLSPARSMFAVTVGAFESQIVNRIEIENMSEWSNHGPCVDILAPRGGYTANIGNNSHYSGSIGTSMSAGIVSGVAATYLEGDPTASPYTVLVTMLDEGSIE